MSLLIEMLIDALITWLVFSVLFFVYGVWEYRQAGRSPFRHALAWGLLMGLGWPIPVYLLIRDHVMGRT